MIASPVAWWVMQRWLQNFAYRVEMDVFTFILAFAVALCIALLTVSYHAVKAAKANPINSLRYE